MGYKNKTTKEYHREWRGKNKDKIKKISKTYYKQHKDKILKNNKEWGENNKEKMREINKNYRKTLEECFRIYKRNAKVRGIEFNINLNEFKSFWQNPCNYCGTNIETIGLDRIDSSMGYFLDNIVSCCTICNKMKMTLPKDIFIEHCRKIVIFNGGL